jgi:hypothetical protein
MPSLEDLPLELRQNIYALVVVAPDTAKIATFFHSRRPNNSPAEVALVAREHGTAKPSVDSENAIVLVSKQTRAEALPMLYQRCSFEFESSRALELFLDQIGDMKQHLRNVSISMGGYEHDTGALFGATKRSFAMLATATGLQSFSVSHFDFCRYQFSPNLETSIENFASACTPFMQTLRDARTAKGIKTGLPMLYIIKLVLPECGGCFACDILRPQHGLRRRGISGAQSSQKRSVCVQNSRTRLKCRCKCLEADRNNNELMKQIKHRIASNLGWE